MDRHGSGERPDVQDPLPVPWNNELGAASSDHVIHDSESSHSNGTENCVFNNDKLAGVSNEPHSCANGASVSENRLIGDAKDLATSKLERLVISNDVTQSSSINGEESKHALHLHFKPSVMGNGEIKNGVADFKRSLSSNSFERKNSGISPVLFKDTNVIVLDNQDQNHLGVHHDDKPPHLALSSEDYHSSYAGNHASPRPNGNSKGLNSLSDLKGDYERHITSLHHGRLWYEHALNMSYSPMSPQLHSQFQNKNSWDVIHRSLQFRRPVIPQINVNGVIPRSMIYPISPQVLPGASFGMEDMPKPRGTGTYFPNTVYLFKAFAISWASEFYVILTVWGPLSQSWCRLQLHIFVELF